jgi:hypothetical protein
MPCFSLQVAHLLLFLPVKGLLLDNFDLLFNSCNLGSTKLALMLKLLLQKL